MHMLTLIYSMIHWWWTSKSLFLLISLYLSFHTKWQYITLWFVHVVVAAAQFSCSIQFILSSTSTYTITNIIFVVLCFDFKRSRFLERESNMKQIQLLITWIPIASYQCSIIDILIVSQIQVSWVS